MRRALVYLIFTLALAIFAYWGTGSDAYVLLRVGDTAVQVTVWVAALMAALLLLAVHLIWALVNGTLLGGWRRAWLRRRLDKLSASALKSYTEQNWSKAYKQLVKLANSQDDPQPYVIMAAEAAVASGDIEQGRQTYTQALIQFPNNSFQVRLKLGYLELGVGNHIAAADICQQLIVLNKRDPDARLLQILIAEDSGDWQLMHELLISARNHKVLSARLPTIERRYLRTRLSQNPAAPQLLNLADLASAETSIPSELSVSLAQQLAMKGSADRAEKFLRKKIEQNWDSVLVEAYSNIEGRSIKAQVKAAESWLVDQAADKPLLEALLRLSVRLDDQDRIERYEQKISAL